MTTFTRTWNAAYEAVPADTDNISEGALRIRNLKEDVQERLEVDHSHAGDANDGAHKKVTLLEQAGNPTSAANTGFIYTKDVAGITEAFWEDSAGTVLQLTSGGKLSGGAFPAIVTSAVEITLTTTAVTLLLTSTDAGSVAAPALELYRNSASPAASDNLGTILFTGKDGGAAKKTYIEIGAKLADPTSPAGQDGVVVIRAINAGTVTDAMSIGYAGVGIGNGASTLGPGSLSVNDSLYEVVAQVLPIHSLTQLTAVQVATGDLLLVRDVSTSAGNADAYKSVAANDVGGMVLLSNQDAANQATLVVDLATYSGSFRHFKLFIDALVPITDVTDLQMRVSTDGGSTYDSGAGNYGHNGVGETSALITNVNNSATLIQLNSATAGLGTAAGEEFSAEMTIFHPASTSKHPKFKWEAVWRNSTPHITVMLGTGQRFAAQDTTHLQFFMSSGNINTGNFRLYGIR